ncbi:MAG TPA: beta-ketoacyl synthase chain length factor [Methylibium sp.]|uniref:beta-ketoacyl synthase chain length factor n=1 Tax=Methylibium sp. TaxID=2067992 RepID=UPI002DBFCCAB|nr:beta-ketoacyl synthase chain length factor [Methylibium sp.]HEU4458197.1 beta-ketoacyl synthase chain length factor [Methylibium sp.]
MSAGAIDLGVLGVGLWAEGLPGWAAARTVLRGDAGWPLAMPGPAPMTLLATAERRRASASVRVAIAVAEEACAQAGIEASTLLSVFASTHGELGLTDEICRTLAAQPEAMSPTRFHNSVHNAASGYWTIGAGCTEASTAISAWQHSFAAGLLEAGVQAASEQRPVLFVAYDAQASGPLASMAISGSSFGAALVLAPFATRGPRLGLRLDAAGPAPQAPPWPIDNPLAPCLPLFAALARETPASLGFPLASGMGLTASIFGPDEGLRGIQEYPR